MNGIIKPDTPGNFGAIRRLEDVRQATAAAKAVADSETERLRKRIAALEAHAQQQDELIETLRAEAHQARIDGEKLGRSRGLAAAEDRQAERLKAIENGIRTALTDFNGSLASLERLAVLVARDCLQMMLGDPGQRMDLLCDMIRLQMSQIEQASLLGVEVSQEDFPATEDLAAVAKRIDPQLISLFSSASIPAGACVMRLRLGSIHVGIDQQWGALDSLLGDMASPGSE
jgi:flagellar biosynthesis/type III secretory pathway protein FliH